MALAHPLSSPAALHWKTSAWTWAVLELTLGGTAAPRREAPLGANVQAGRVFVTHGFSSHLGGQSPLVGLGNGHSFLPASPDTVPKETAPTTLPPGYWGSREVPAGVLFSKCQPPRVLSYSRARLVTKPLLRTVLEWNRGETGKLSAAKLDNSEADVAIHTDWRQTAALLRRAGGRKRGVGRP